MFIGHYFKIRPSCPFFGLIQVELAESLFIFLK